MSRSGNKGYVLVAVVYLLGLFIGALDTGIVTPARTVIQNDLHVGDQAGVWLISIYTLAYAAAIPIMGKIADRHGRKYVYLASITLFGLGSLFCGLAQDFGSFNMLLIARAIQAIGGGGIVPIATAEFGTAFPEKKRGMALGLVGGVYGIANVFGASAGSLILDIFGQTNWQFIFYVNIPICLFILITGLIILPNTKEHEVRPLDLLGVIVLTGMVLSLLYGLRNLDFFNFVESVATTEVYPFLLIFIVLLPIFVFVENRAADPVLNLSYFKNVSIIVTLVLAIISGTIMMGMIFIPQFAENAMMMPSGAGGYFIIILGLFTGIGSPMSGKLIDKFGVKIVLGFGFLAAGAGALFLVLVATNDPSVANVVISLILIGLGMGFTMGAPLNYMMLAKTDEAESNSALATLSLVRSIGTSIAPAIMAAFLAHAGATIPAKVIAELPEPPMGQAIEMNMDAVDGEMEVSDEALKGMKTSDVTTIVANIKVLASEVFDSQISHLEESAGQNVDADTLAVMTGAKEDYLHEIDGHADQIQITFQQTLNEGFRGLFSVVAVCSLIGLVLLFFYHDEARAKRKKEGANAAKIAA